jgi:DNA polymerase/3'-5' exonuclease PolX
MNAKILENLKKLESQAKLRGETYRSRAFKRAIDKISTLKTPLKDAKVLKGLPGIGKGIIDRVDEILETG